MSTPYIDPNSGAAPQPGGITTAIVDSESEQAPRTPQDAEVLRQQNVTEVQADAKQGTEDAKEPEEAERPEMAEPTNESPESEDDQKSSGPKSSGKKK